MHIDKIIYQSRRDFKAIFVCEHCGNKTTPIWGYDDVNYHQNVIPNMKCKSCGKTADDTYRPLTTKYPEWMNV